VRTVFPEAPVLPVRTDGEVPKKIIPALMRELSTALVTERIGIGGTVIRDILGTGCDIIATSDMLKS
jgi:CxxC motif-containing protein